MEFLFWFSVFSIGYAYFGYPLILQALLAIRGKSIESQRTGARPESLSVIISARNEEAVIAEKIKNTLEAVQSAMDNGATWIEVIVASDSSDDQTDSIVRGFAGQAVRLVRTEVRGGKERAQQAALAEAKGQILVFTDAKVQMRRDALVQFLDYFQDPTIGAVSSVDRVASAAPQSGTQGASSEEGSGEGFYVRYEMWLRSLETGFGSLVGLSGSCFAIRKAVSNNWREDLPSDFASLIQAVTWGLRGVSAPEIICTYTAVRSEEEEFSRKVRTVLRGISTFMASLETLNPFKFGLFAWQIFSHKLMRWLVPWFFILGLVTGSAAHGFLGRMVFLGMIGLSILALVAFVRPEYRRHIICKIPLFFCVSNAAILVAWLQYFGGRRAVMWTPSAKQ